MKTAILVLPLLCVFSLFPITELAQQTSPEDQVPKFIMNPIDPTKLEQALMIKAEVLYNVSDTGTLIRQGCYTVIISDHHGSIRVSYSFDAGFELEPTPDGKFRLVKKEYPPRRVVFKLGIMDLRNFLIIPEGRYTFVEEYLLDDLPKNADVILLAKLFGCRLGQTTYDSGFDLDSNNIINAQDVVIAIRNLRQIQSRIP